MQLKESIPVLTKYVNSKSSKIKIAVAKALGEMNYEEAKEQLRLLSSDRDEYVQVAVEIAQQKQEKGYEAEAKNTDEVFHSIFFTPEWLLDEEWFEKNTAGFRMRYKMIKSQPLSRFANMDIMPDEMITQRRRAIQKELTSKLMGCTDVDEIISAKNVAQKQIDMLATKDQLIKAILDAPDGDLSPAASSNLNKALDFASEDVMRAVVIASVNKSNPIWVALLNIVIDQANDSSYIDLVIYSLACKLNSSALTPLIKLIDLERARYYLLYLYNYLYINTNAMKIRDLQVAKKTLRKLSINPQTAESIMVMLTVLQERMM